MTPPAESSSPTASLLSPEQHQAARNGAPLIALRDFYRIPLWLASTPLYMFASPSIFFWLADLRGTIDWLRPRRRRKVLSRLERHLGDEYSQPELHVIARRYMQSRRRWDLTTTWPQMRGFTGAQEIAVDGLEHLDRALSGGNGVIILAAHYGYTRLIKPVLRSLGSEPLLFASPPMPTFGPRFSIMGELVHDRILRLPRMSLFDRRCWETVGSDLIVGLNLRECISALKRNRIVIILADGRTARVLRRFSVLGLQVELSSGAVSIARQTGAAALPAFVVDDPELGGAMRLRLAIGAPLEIQATDDAHADLEANLRRFAAVYDRVAREYPHNWEWYLVKDGVFRPDDAEVVHAWTHRWARGVQV